MSNPAQSSFADALVEYLQQTVIQTDREYQSAVAGQDQARAERDQAISERDQARAERDQAISERDQARAERDQALTEQDAARAVLQRVLTSRSWRWTAALRSSAGTLRGPRD